MNSITRCAVVIITLILSVGAAASIDELPPGPYALEKTHGYITFSYSHLGFSNPHVGFTDFDVSLDLDPEALENSAINVTIDATSIDSRVAEFNDHLNGDKFFDTEKYPTITFKSSKIAAAEDGKYDVTGDLTIKNVTRPVTLKTTINKTGNHPMKNVPAIGIGANTELSRSDWGLGEHVPYVGDNVTIYIQVELLQGENE